MTEKPDLTCDICGKTFKNLAGLNGHLATVHGAVDTEKGPKKQESTNLLLDFFLCLAGGNATLTCCLQLNVSPLTGTKWANAFYRMQLAGNSFKQVDKRIDDLEKELEKFNDRMHKFMFQRCEKCGGVEGFNKQCVECGNEDVMGYKVE